ncbi:MAG: carbohydrate ABC transporter permease [Oscillospiraceae bacterium]
MKKNTTVSGLDKFNRIGVGANAVFNIIFILMAIICVVPVLFVIGISFSSEASIAEYGYRIIPAEVSFDGYAYMFKQGTMIIRALGNSLFITVAGTALGVLLTTLMGYVISRPNYRLKKLMTLIVFIPMVFNGGLVSTYFVVSQLLHLGDTMAAMILPIAVSSFNIIICKTFFRMTIPESLVEAAKIDGARQFTIFFKIVLPISLPVLATIGLFLCFNYWNDWWQAMLYINDTSLYTLQALLNQLMRNIEMLAQNASQFGISQAELVASMPKEAARMSIVVLIVLPIACAYPFFQNYFISGLTIGAVKG